MNVKKNPFYYINTVFFLVLTVYSLLVCINIFEMDNIDMNAGLCAVIVSMVLCLVMYLIYAMRVRNMLAANPILKTSLEVISVLIFLTLSCVVRVYMMGEFELDIMREGIVLLCMFMAYLTARMLNQFGFVTLMCLVPWPYLISTYNYDLQELIQMAAVIAGICVLSVIIFAVRKNPSLKLAAMVLFLIVVAAYFFYEMYQAGLRSIYMENYKKYIECFNKMFEFTQFERFYFIALVMAAIIGGIRLFLGPGSANTLILYVVNVLCCFTITFDLGPMYLQFMYPLLAMAAAGSLGTRPAHEDQEVQLKDNLENVKVKYNKKDAVGLNYVDDSELDKMLADIEKDQRYISHKNLSASSQEDDNEEVPVELSMYDSALSRPDEDNANEKTVSAPQPMAAPVYEPVASTPVYEPVRPVTPAPEPIAPAPSYEPVRPATPAPEPIAPAPVYEPVRPAAPVQEPSIPAPAYESIMATPAYETIEKQTEVFSYEPQYQYEEQKPSYEPQYQYEEQKPSYEPQYHYEEQKPSYEPEYHYEEQKSSYEPEYRYEEEQTVTKPQVSYYEPEPVMKEEPTIEPVVMPVYPTMEEKAEEPRQPEVSSYEPEYNYEEEKPSYEPEYHYEEQKPSYEPEYHYEEQKPSYEPEYHYEEQKPSYEPEYHYEEEQTVTEPKTQVSYYEPEPVMKEEPATEPVVTPVYPTMEEAEEPRQPEVFSYEPEYNYEEEKSSYEPEYNYEEEKPSYEPEYHYEEEQTVTEPEPQVSYYEPEPVMKEEPAIEPVVTPVYPTMEEKAEEPKQPEVSSYEPEYHYEEEQTVTKPEPQVSYYEPEPVMEEPAVEPSQPEPVVPSYETVSFKEPVYETLVREEPQNLEPHVLIKNPVSFENERGSETSQTNEDNGIGQSKPMFETMGSFFSNNLEIDNAPKFEMSQQDAQSFSAYSAANEIYTPIDSLDELFTNVDAGLEFEEADGKKQPYNEDDELVEEPVSIHKDNFDDFSDGIAPVVLDRQKDDEDEIVTSPAIKQAVPQQEVTMPESIELGIDLEEDFGFGQTQSFTDFYDTDNTPVFAGFEEVQEVASPEFAVQMPETEFVSKQYEETVKMDVPVMESPVIEAPVMEEMTIPEAAAPVMEEMTIPEAVAPIMEEMTIPEAVAPMVEEIVIPEPVKEPEFAKVPEEIVTEQTFVQPAVENYAEDIPVQPEPVVQELPVQPVPAVEEIPVPPAAPKKEEEPVKQINPFAKEADFFDWSTYDGSVEEESEQVVETAENEPIKQPESNGFEEFVWTDEMIKKYAEGPKETALQPEAVTEVIQEIAATAVPEQAFEPVVNVSAKIPPVQPTQTEVPPVQPVQIEIPTVQKTQVEMPPVQPVQREIPTSQPVQTEIPIVQKMQTEIPVPQPEPVTERPVYPESAAQEEETPQYQVFQSSGNFRIEEPEENEDEAPQYQVFQSSGNFRIEEPEEEAEEAPQYQVYHSSGNFQLEEPEEEVEPTLITYGGPQQQKTEPVTTKPATSKPASGQRFDDFEFDLDLPDFEPFDATKR